MTNPKIIFIGTSQFAVQALENLIKNKYNIIKVITKPITLESEKISKLAPDLIIVAAYGKIIPSDILSIPRFGCLNLHPSLLPKYRGPSPIQTAILNGDETTGLTIILMDEKIDHGPIIAQKKMKISPEDNYQSLEKKLAQLAADFLIEILPQYFQGKIKTKPQNESKASYTKILTRQDGQIDWQQSAVQIARQVRAFYPWPGAWTEFNGLRVKILKAKAVDKKLLLEIVQPAGKKPMTGQEFFRGHPNVKVSVL